MKTRVLAGLIMMPLLVVLLLGGRILLAACFLVAVMGVREFYLGFQSMGIQPCAPIGYFAAVGLYGIGLWTLYPEMMPAVGESGGHTIWYLLWAFAATVASLLYLFSIEKRSLADGMATLTGIFYVVFLSYHVVLVERNFGIGVWFIVLTAFGTDIFAYFTGFLIGKHKLCPKISPKKTIEGAVGGAVGSVLLCVLFSVIFMKENLVGAAILGLLGGIIAQFGDLTASIFKRHMGIKDYGNLIPGHGGVLDRVDSILFTAPLVYYVLTLVQ